MPAYKKMPDAMRECSGPECGGCSSGSCYAKGGEVKGVHKPYEAKVGGGKGQSYAGDQARWGQATAGLKSSERHHDKAKEEHHRVLGEMKSMKKPNLYAEGGEVADGDGDMDMDDELNSALGGEFVDAMERKDRKGIMSALEAIVLSCRGKE